MPAPRVVFVKAIGQAVDLTTTPVRADEPTRAQAASGRYPKRAMQWKGLTIRIENEAGSVRRGAKPDGSPWETRMAFPYGEIARTEGVDGDPVDVFIGPFAETAEQVFVIHQRRVDDWERYDEDKCMIGWLTEAEAREAFLQCYDDPRFLGPITAMPVAEFVAKVKATRKAPRMIKAVQTITRKDGVTQRYHIADPEPEQPAEQSLADDMEAQMAWLDEQATEMGYAGLEDLVAQNYPAFEQLAAKWRDDHPVDVALKSFADEMLKARVGPYIRGGKLVNIHGYDGRQARASKSPGQASLFSENDAPAPQPKKADMARHDHTNVADLFEGTPAAAPISAERAERALLDWIKNDPRKGTLLWTESDFAQRKGLPSREGMRRLAISSPSGRVLALAMFEDNGREVELHFIGSAEKGTGRKMLEAVEAANPGKAIVANINGSVLDFYRGAGYEVTSSGGYYHARKAPAAPVKQTDTPQFRAWFGDSKVTRDGEPLRMYHASYRDFDQFDRRKSVEWRRMETMDTVGSWFSDNPGRDGGAGMYAGGEGAVMYPVYLSIQNPKFYATFYEFLDDMHLAAGRDPSQQNPKGRGTTEELRAKLKAEGYDGIRFGKTYTKQVRERLAQIAEKVRKAKDDEWAAPKKYRAQFTERRMKAEEEHRQIAAKLRNNESTEFDDQEVWVAFEPEQIKSAIGNNGDFSKDSPVITKSMPVLFLKTHVEAYTKKDGTFVAAHEANLRTLYHGSSEHVAEIKNKGLFGGIFASGDRESAMSHGEIVHRIDLPDDKVMTQSQLDEVSDEDLKAVAHWVDDEDLERLRELVIGDDKADDDDAKILRTDDAGEASWEAQRLRGALAKRAGFQAVEMNDEHGTSYLVLPGAKIERESNLAKSLPILFLKAKHRGDDRTADMFGTHVEARTRKDGHVQNYHVANAKKDAALDAAITHLKEDAHQADMPAHERKEDKALVVKLQEARGGAGNDTAARRKAALAVLGDGWKSVPDGKKDAYKRSVKLADGGRYEVMIKPARTVAGDFYVGSYFHGGKRSGPGNAVDHPKTLEEAKGVAEGWIANVVSPESSVTVTAKKKIRDPLEGTQTHVTLSNGKTHRIQRLNATESMGLPGWHDVDGGFLADDEQGAIDELVRRASAPKVARIVAVR